MNNNAGASVPLKFEARNSMKIIRRDGTIEEIPGEWAPTTEEDAVAQFGANPDFNEWLRQKKEG